MSTLKFIWTSRISFRSHTTSQTTTRTLVLSADELSLYKDYHCGENGKIDILTRQTEPDEKENNKLNQNDNKQLGFKNNDGEKANHLMGEHSAVSGNFILFHNRKLNKKSYDQQNCDFSNKTKMCIEEEN